MTSGIGKARIRERDGFTLIELCMAGAIVTLIASVCWPSLKEFTQTIVMRAQAQELIQKFYNAREQAILSGSTQTVTPGPTERIFCSAPSAVFFSDGSAQYFQMEWKAREGRRLEIIIEESGKILYQEI